MPEERGVRTVWRLHGRYHLLARLAGVLAAGLAGLLNAGSWLAESGPTQTLDLHFLLISVVMAAGGYLPYRLVGAWWHRILYRYLD